MTLAELFRKETSLFSGLFPGPRRGRDNAYWADWVRQRYEDGWKPAEGGKVDIWGKWKAVNRHAFYSTHASSLASAKTANFARCVTRSSSK